MNITPNFWLPFLFSAKQVENDILDKIDHDKAMADELPKEYILSSYESTYSSPEVNHQTYQRINELFERCACHWYLNPLTSRFHICVRISHFYQCKKIKIIKSLIHIVPKQAQIELLKQNLIDFTNVGMKYFWGSKDCIINETATSIEYPIEQLEKLYANHILDSARPIQKIKPNEIRIYLNSFWKNHSFIDHHPNITNNFEHWRFWKEYFIIEPSIKDHLCIGKYIFSGLFSIFNGCSINDPKNTSSPLNNIKRNEEQMRIFQLLHPFLKIRDEVYEKFLSPKLRRAIHKESNVTNSLLKYQIWSLNMLIVRIFSYF